MAQNPIVTIEMENGSGKAAVPAGAMAAGEVALAGYRGLMQNREIIVPGVRNRLLRLFPTGLKMAVVGRVKRAQLRKKREDA